VELEKQTHRHDQRNTNKTQQMIPGAFEKRWVTPIQQFRPHNRARRRVKHQLLVALRAIQGATFDNQLIAKLPQFFRAVKQALPRNEPLLWPINVVV
jgi:hypothetical protein